MKPKIITFWAPVKRQGGCSTCAALYASYLSHVIDETEKVVVISLNTNIDASDYLTLNSIKNGCKDLLFLSETNNIHSKEDVLAYTHKICNNLDLLGTGKDEELLSKYNKIIEILSDAYDYIIIDAVTGCDVTSNKCINLSDVTVVCVPQDKFVYESMDMSIFENKKVIFLSSMHNSKNEFSTNKIQVMLETKVYPIGWDNRVNKAVCDQEVYKLIGSEIKRKSSIISELSALHNETNRLINIERLNITYELKKSKDAIYIDNVLESHIKIVKEYKFIKAKNNIAIFNISQGAGSTFISLNLAYLLKDKKVDVSVIELPHDNMKADIFNTIIEDNSTSEKSYIKNGIKYYVNNHINEKMDKAECMEHISKISKESTVNIYDIGSQALDEYVEFLFNIIDVAIIIIDPIPYKLLQAEEKIKSIKKLEERNINVVYVLNKYIKDLNKRDIEMYLEAKISSCIPFISPEILYAAYYSYQTVYQFEKSELFIDSLNKILSAANILEYEGRKENKKLKLFKWR